MKQQNRWSKILHSAVMTASAAGMAVAAAYLFIPRNSGIDPITTATVADAELRGAKDVAALNLDGQTKRKQNLDTLKSALSAFDSNDMDAVRQALKDLKPTDAEHQYISWLMAVSGKRDVTANEIRDAQERLQDWPNQDAMQRNLEAAMARGGFSALRLRFTLGDNEPKSFQSAFAIARTHLVTGGNDKIRALLTPYWHTDVLSAGDEALVIDTFGDVLTKRDHEIRYFNMMTRERVRSGARLVELIDAKALHAAWTAVIRRKQNAASLMNALSANDKQTMAYSYMRVEHLRRADNDNEAIKVLNSLPTDPAEIINPDAWWNERRIISRNKFEAGDAQTAYDIVAAHRGGDEKTRVDAAFHAGWYALRGQDDRQKAQAHFEEITKVAKGNISRARGFYWLGRSLSGDEAETAYTKAAEFATTYYGQLASAALGAPLASAGLPAAKRNIGDMNMLKAIDRLADLGEVERARSLYIALGWHISDPSEVRAISDHAALRGDHYAALKIAKAADWRGVDVGMLTHPTGAISDATALAPSDHALAYAVARQESEFNVSAVSRANARGILQLLPGTAREMARRQSIAYEPEKLTSDANYNARLGAAYLNQQLDRFDGSYILTFAAYNAGPSRAKEWIERFGDPRGKSIEDVVDWVEQIPFPETRSYVQRILENFQVYKLQLGQQASIVDDLRFGRDK